MTGCSGCQVWTSARPGLLAASGAAGRLLQQLEGALGRARIAVGEADVGVDDADERQQRKVVALGDELRADDDVVGAARRRLQFLAQRLEPAGKVDDSTSDAPVRKQRVRLLGEPLDARAAGGQAVGLVALRAEVGPALDMAAMVADERAAEAMLDQPGRAVGALEAMAAGAAERERRIAAPVEEQQRLLAARQRLLDARRSARGESQRPRGGPSRRRSTAAMSRQRAPRRSARAARASGSGRCSALTRVSIEGVAEASTTGAPLQPRAHHRHVARVIDDAVLLLVGALVLLIDDDEAEVGERQEQRRARADDHARLAARRPPPRALALALGQARMPFGRPHAEARGEAVEKLRGQRDLRQQDERLALLPQGFRDRLEIDLGLARSGDAFEQGAPRTRGRRRGGREPRPRRADRR